MPEETLRYARQDIERAEKELDKAVVLVKTLREAGEDTQKLDRKIEIQNLRLIRFKKAFEVL